MEMIKLEAGNSELDLKADDFCLKVNHNVPK